MFTGITFCWVRHIFNTTLISPVAFEGRALCALVIAFCWTSQLFSTTLIGPVAFEGRSYVYWCYILLDQPVI